MPSDPEVHRFQELLTRGYDAYRNNDAAGACGPWLEAWPLFLKLLDEKGWRSIREFDERLDPKWLASNWVQDLEASLWNGGLKESRLFHDGIRYASEFLERFPAENDLTVENMRRAMASFHCRLGETERVDALYEEWLSRDPQWGWGWIGWSDCYRFDCGNLDPAKAEGLLQRGLSTPNVRDEIDVLERLLDLYESQGRDEEAGPIRERLERDATLDDNPYASDDDEPAEEFFDPGIEPIRRGPKIGRNQPCPCGSGKKYKKCCGR
jgi:hypothetical protein